VAGEVALEVDGGPGCEVGEIGDLTGRDEYPMAVSPLAGWVARGEEQEAEVAVCADGAGEAGHQADEAGVFLLLTGLVGIGIFVYSAGYTRNLGGPLRQAASLALLNLSVGAVILVLAAGTPLTLLVAWGAMSILTWPAERP
jgi:formate hydrogenlyase subunit 3/multisubunit Na+/H+ antiporter MnhD subunit